MNGRWFGHVIFEAHWLYLVFTSVQLRYPGAARTQAYVDCDNVKASYRASSKNRRHPRVYNLPKNNVSPASSTESEHQLKQRAIGTKRTGSGPPSVDKTGSAGKTQN
jgi:hypothetical protein